MNKKTAEAVKKRFLTWSGGFPPDSEDKIFLYVEYAMSCENDEEEVRDLLRDWMRQEDQFNDSAS